MTIVNQWKMRIDNIDWANLNHAFGPAVDLPALLKDLFSDDQEKCSQSIDELFGNICHQGTVYEATSYAVPFIFAALDDPETPKRDELIGLLGCIATGESYHAVHQPEKVEEVRKEMIWVDRARNEIILQLDTAIRLLSDQDRLVRQGAAFLLACFPKEQDRLRPPLLEAFELEKSGHCRIVMGLSLSLLGEFRERFFKLNRFINLPVDRLKRFARSLSQGDIPRREGLFILQETALETFEEQMLDQSNTALE
jgi:hypothetical protein